MGGMFQQGQQQCERQVTFWMAVHSCRTRKWRVFWSAHAQIGRLQQGNCGQNWILSSMNWKWWWQCWNTAKFAPSGSCECSYGNRKHTICKFVKTYWTNTRLKVTVSWVTLLQVTRCGVTTMSWSKNGNPWSGNTWIPHWKIVQGVALNW